MHAQFTRRLALVPPVLLQDVHDEPLLEFTYGLRVKNAATVHLRHESFELVLHRFSLTFQMRHLSFCFCRFAPNRQAASPAAALVAPAARRSAHVRPRDLITCLSLRDWARRGVWKSRRETSGEHQRAPASLRRVPPPGSPPPVVSQTALLTQVQTP